LNAIVPIRAGSQRVKNKNIFPINEKPLYTYIVETLKKVDQIDKIIINTDYKFFKELFADDPMIHIMERDKELRGNCNINLIIQRVLEEYNGQYFLQTHTTNPLLSDKTISSAINYFQKHNQVFDSLFSVTKVQKRFWTEKSIPINHSEGDEPTTQNLKPMYEENSCIYIFSQSSFYKAQNRIGSKPCVFPIPKIESIDIDDMEDMEMITKIMV